MKRRAEDLDASDSDAESIAEMDEEDEKELENLSDALRAKI
jgi:hypothetical protein